MSASQLWGFLSMHLVLTTIVGGAAFVARWWGDTSPKARFVGWVVVALSVAGFFFAGLVNRVFSKDGYYPTGTALLGLFGGFISGHILGRYFWYYFEKGVERDEDTP